MAKWLQFSKQIDAKVKMVKMTANSDIKSCFVLFQPKSWPKVENGQKWSRFKLCSKWLQMGPNNHVKWYFVPFQPKSWPKVENRQKWSRFELCSKWLQMGPNNHIKWYFGPFLPKSWPKVENGQKWSQFELCSKWLQMGLIVISTHILSHFSQKVDQKWKMAKVKSVRTLLKMTPNGP